MKMDEYQTKRKPVTYAGGDGLIDVVNFVPEKGFRAKAIDTAIGDPASWQHYTILFPKQIKGKPESRTLDGYR